MAGVKVEEKFYFPSGHIWVLMDDEWGVEILGEHGIDGETVSMGSWDFTTEEAWKEWGTFCITAIDLNKKLFEQNHHTEERAIAAIEELDKHMSEEVIASLVKTQPAALKMLEVSTGHIQEATAIALDTHEGIPGIVCYNKERYGWFIYIPDYILDESVYEKDEIPEELHELMVYAHKRGCEWIMFDCDVEPNEQLPVFDW